MHEKVFWEEQAVSWEESAKHDQRQATLSKLASVTCAIASAGTLYFAAKGMPEGLTYLPIAGLGTYKMAREAKDEMATRDQCYQRAEDIRSAIA